MNIKSFFRKKIISTVDQHEIAILNKSKTPDMLDVFNDLDTYEKIYNLDSFANNPNKLLEYVDNLVFKPIDAKNKIVSKTQEKILKLRQNKMKLESLLESKFPMTEEEKSKKIDELSAKLQNINYKRNIETTIEPEGIFSSDFNSYQRLIIKQDTINQINKLKNTKNDVILKNIFDSQKQIIIDQIKKISNLINTLEKVIQSANEAVAPLLCVKKEVADIIEVAKITKEISEIVKVTEEIEDEYRYCFEAIKLLHNYCLESSNCLNQLAEEINNRNKAECELQVAI